MRNRRMLAKELEIVIKVPVHATYLLILPRRNDSIQPPVA
jgi:hypothetical protein